MASRRVHQWPHLPEPRWLLPAGLAGLFLYVRSRRWTGGRELRERLRRDLAANAALVHHIRTRDAILFDEREDEGPIVFVLTDTGETLVFLGQDLSRDVARGFPWRERFPPSTKRPPLSPDAFRQLGLGSVRRWQRLPVAFEDLREVT
jgi:hypothetical protein